VPEEIKVRPFAATAEPILKSSAELCAEEETVLMSFPHALILTLPDHTRVKFNKGVQNVPVSLATHQYLKDSGVKAFKPNAPIEIQITEHHAKYFTLIVGSDQPKTIDDVKSFMRRIGPYTRSGFLDDAAAWKEPVPVNTPATAPAAPPVVPPVASVSTSAPADDDQDGKGKSKAKGTR
jgi:hypothetical protein